MNDSAPLSSVMGFIQEELLRGDAKISPNDDLLEGGHVDSMGIMRLVAFLESDFGISVPPEDVTIENFQCGQTIANYVLRQIENRTE